MKRRDHDARVLQEAWIGDAVLLLFARELVLAERGQIDVEMVERLVANRFLATLGQPDAIEAEIGRIYARDGLAAAFAHLQARIVPAFRRQDVNRHRGRQGRRVKPHA
jgi:hypothetical protein